MSISVPAPRRQQPSAATVLAADRRRVDTHPAATVTTDRARRGAVCREAPGGAVVRAEPGPAGPLVLRLRRHGEQAVVEILGPEVTPSDTVERTLEAAVAWAGLDDDRTGFVPLVAGHRLLARLVRELGVPRLSRLPRVGEALGRAVLAQLVQTVEARRSTAQVAALLGRPAPLDLWCWPTPAEVGAAPYWILRRCGVSLRGAGALHQGAVHDARLCEAARDCATSAPADAWHRLDRRLRALRGVGGWTAAEVRAALGDPDAVSVGDYNLPTLVGHVLGDDPRRARAGPAWTDEEMLALLAPFAPQRARVVRLIGAALRRGLVDRPGRRAPRAALSAHRYW